MWSVSWYTDTMKYEAKVQESIKLAYPVLQKLEEAGHEAWLVGGCVREALRDGYSESVSSGGTDLDVTTDALPEEVERIFMDERVIETGLAHGTVTVLLREDPDRPLPIEITTYRTESTYSDGRHPDHVEFVKSLEDDLSRRDFTINAMALDMRARLADPFGGADDLKNHLIRAVGDPETRFREDGLRILRALRFSSVLGYEIEPETSEALFRCRDLLKNLSAERVFTELKKLLRGASAGDVIRRYIDILSVVLPELGDMKDFAQNNPYHRYDVLEHCIRAMEAIRTTPENRDYMLLAALFHDVGKPRNYSEDERGIGHFYGHPHTGSVMTEEILRRLKADRFTIDRVTTLIRYHDLVFQDDPHLLKRWMNRYSPEILREILELKRADNIGTGNISDELLEKFDHIAEHLEEIISSQECFTLSDLDITGNDIMDAGIPEGPEVGRILEDLLEHVIDEDLPNEKDVLLQHIPKTGGSR